MSDRLGIGADRGFGLLWQAFSDDITLRQRQRHEFPLTAMSRALAVAIAKIPVSGVASGAETGRSLDVGAGTGVHAGLMAAQGYDSVDLLDVNPTALECTERRLISLSDLIQSVRPHRPSPRFGLTLGGLDQGTPNGSRYALISFNAPAYYDLLGVNKSSPAAQGVYVDDSTTASLGDYHAALLYRFFDKVVLPYLQVGGSVVCSWPGLERRVVESAREGGLAHTVPHPASVLKSWFNIELAHRVPPAEDFYRRKALITHDYGTGQDFFRNLEAARRAGLYSNLLVPGTGRAESHFRFGILRMLRLPGRARFQVVET